MGRLSVETTPRKLLSGKLRWNIPLPARDMLEHSCTVPTKETKRVRSCAVTPVASRDIDPNTFLKNKKVPESSNAGCSPCLLARRLCGDDQQRIPSRAQEAVQENPRDKHRPVSPAATIIIPLTGYYLHMSSAAVHIITQVYVQ